MVISMVDWSGIVSLFKDTFTNGFNFVYDLYTKLDILNGWIVLFLTGVVISTIIFPFIRSNQFGGGVGAFTRVKSESSRKGRK